MSLWLLTGAITTSAGIAGAVTLSLSPAATLDYTRNADITGALTLLLVPAATMLHSKDIPTSFDPPYSFGPRRRN
jgi:hypothetical protein